MYLVNSGCTPTSFFSISQLAVLFRRRLHAPHILRDSHAAGSVEEWMQWRESVKVGMRKPLGLDFGKRRYWALGGRSACWRVYVEEAEGRSWGWYEGQ